MNPFDAAWTLLKQQSLPPHPAAIQGLMARQYAADDENYYSDLEEPLPGPPTREGAGEVYDEEMEYYLQDLADGAYEPWHRDEFTSEEGPSGSNLRERMIQDEMRGRLARQSTGLARGGGDEHIDAEAYNQLAAESMPYYGQPSLSNYSHLMRR